MEDPLIKKRESEVVPLDVMFKGNRGIRKKEVLVEKYAKGSKTYRLFQLIAKWTRSRPAKMLNCYR